MEMNSEGAKPRYGGWRDTRTPFELQRVDENRRQTTINEASMNVFYFDWSGNFFTLPLQR
jgi:hypothetical protein